MQGTLQRDPSKRPVMKSLLQVRIQLAKPLISQPLCSFIPPPTSLSPHPLSQHAYISAGAWKGNFDESSLRAIVKWTMQAQPP
jgi:hypothetical protein